MEKKKRWVVCSLVRWHKEELWISFRRAKKHCVVEKNQSHDVLPVAVLGPHDLQVYVHEDVVVYQGQLVN